MTVHIRFPKRKRKEHAKKNISELDNNWELPARSRPTADSGFMARIFGGPTSVEALSNPTRRSTKATFITSARPSHAETDVESTLTDVGATDRPEDTTPQQQTPPPRKTRAWPSKSPRVADELSVRQVPRWKDSSFRDLSPDGGNSPLFVTPLAAEGEGSIFPVDFDLDKRRELEEELIRKFDRPDINTHMGEFWFLVDARWMNSWVAFITGKAGPPGMITNYNLFNQRRPSTAEKHDAMMIRHAADYRRRGGVMANRPGLTLKKELQKIKDYRALHPFTWYLFREMYTTDDAPEVCRWKADIYSPEVGVLHKKRVDQAIHIQASYEMRRFAARIKDMQRSSSQL